MAIYNLGSINADYVYQVPHIVTEGETLAATSRSVGLGGKGANQSVAAARAGAGVFHIGAVGEDGLWARDRLAAFGVDVEHVRVAKDPTAHAIISVAASGENAIIIFPGANAQQTGSAIEAALAQATSGDTLLLQNETNGQVEAAKTAKARGLRVIYSAAPFDVEAVREVIDHVDVLVLNAVEAAQLQDASGGFPDVDQILITRGAEGAEWRDLRTGEGVKVAAAQVDPVDTTGAGDTYLGYFAAGIDAGLNVRDAMKRASIAAAIMVTRLGTADVIPSAAEVDSF